MNKRFWKLFLLIVLFSSYVQASAQEAGTIVFAEGKEFSVSRGSEMVSFKADSFDVIGLVVNIGDLVFTESGTFLEIQLTNTGSILRIAENTTFQLKKAEKGGASEIKVLYGRVRAKVAVMTGSESFTIRGQNAVAGVRGTDFGYDVIALRDSNPAEGPVTNIYCFEGSVEVTPVIDLPGTALSANNEVMEPKTVTIGAREMVAITSEMTMLSSPPPIRVAAIDSTISGYWERNSFKIDKPIDIPAKEIKIAAEMSGADTALQPAPAAKTISIRESDELPDSETESQDSIKVTIIDKSVADQQTQAAVPVKPKSERKGLKNESVLTGIFMLSGGAVLGSGGIALYLLKDPSYRSNEGNGGIGTALMTVGGSFIITGAFALLKSIFMSD